MGKNQYIKICKNDSHEPCKLYSYYTKHPKMVTVPRDIYRQNLKAIQIAAEGSMFENQVAFITVIL